MAGRYGKEPITCGVRFVDTKMARDRRIVREVIDKRKRCEGLTTREGRIQACSGVL